MALAKLAESRAVLAREGVPLPGDSAHLRSLTLSRVYDGHNHVLDSKLRSFLHKGQ